MRKYITEFIGTFFLVLIIAFTSEPLAIGSILMVMIYAGGHISGGHYNPAVTLAVWLRGKITINQVIPYMIAQFFGAVSASLLYLWFLQNAPSLPSAGLGDKTILALVAEFCGTFALAYVVLNVATTKGTAGNSFYGLAIGFTVFACATALGKFSRGAFNPAVAIGACIAKAFLWKEIWVYLIGCFAGGGLAALVFNYLNIEDKTVPPLDKKT